MERLQLTEWQERGRGLNGQVHEGKERSMSVQFIDQHERLCALLDDPRIEVWWAV